ncbi:MAG: LacI family DNA-binding transcriptional regulator, partial [Frankia sp.]|nr:LacI family DNA-binding transcriptional regulator [Frankia sp.]
MTCRADAARWGAGVIPIQTRQIATGRALGGRTARPREGRARRARRAQGGATRVPGEHATIYDVAGLAGVSISTVSHTLNRPHRVNPATRQRVLDAIDALGYVPKETAIARARKGVGRVGVLAPFTSYESYRRRLRGILLEAQGEATEIVIYDHESA